MGKNHFKARVLWKSIHTITQLKAHHSPQKRSHIDKREVSINVNIKTWSVFKMKELSGEGVVMMAEPLSGEQHKAGWMWVCDCVLESVSVIVSVLRTGERLPDPTAAV